MSVMERPLEVDGQKCSARYITQVMFGAADDHWTEIWRDGRKLFQVEGHPDLDELRDKAAAWAQVNAYRFDEQEGLVESVAVAIADAQMVQWSRLAPDVRNRFRRMARVAVSEISALTGGA